MRNYYNKAQKEEYIKENLNRNRFLNETNFNTFVRISKMEEVLKKDACNFTIDEIIGWYKSLLSTSLESLMHNNSQLKIYTDWCIKKGYTKDFQNHYDEITAEVINECLNKELVDKLVLTRQELISVIEKEIQDNPSDRFLLLALFEGICGKEMSDLSMLKFEDFIVENGKPYVKLFSGKKVGISERLLRYAKETQDTDVYIAYGEHGRIFSFKPSSVDNKLLRGLYNVTDTDDLVCLRKRLYNKIVRIRNYTNVAGITQKALINSGRIYFIKTALHLGNKFEDIIASKEFKDKYGELLASKRWLLKYEKYILN